MVSAFYILFWPAEGRCEVLLNRRYKNELPSDRKVLAWFQQAYISESVVSGPAQFHVSNGVPPILEAHGISYIFTHRPNNVIFMAATQDNLNVMSHVVFLDSFYRTVSYYLQRDRNEPKAAVVKPPTSNTSLMSALKLSSSSSQSAQTPPEIPKPVSNSTPNYIEKNQGLTRDTISDNLVVIFDLLDECMDYGLIQLTDYNILKEYIKMEVHLPKIRHVESESSDSDSESDIEETKKKKKKTKTKKGKEVKATYNQANIEDVVNQDTSLVNSSILRTYSSSINWRPKGIFYAKNEIYIDIVESCEFLYDLGKQKTTRNIVFGTCMVKCYLSGMPICEVGFNGGRGEGNQLPQEVVEPDDSDTETDSKALLQEENPNTEEEEDNTKSPDQTESLPVEQAEISDNNSENGTTHSNRTSDQLAASEQLNRFSLSNVPDSHAKIRNVQFHQCTKLNSLQRTNLVSFVPPDDKFVLMTYNVEQQTKKKPLIMIEPIYKVTSDTLQIMCVLNTNIKRRLHCHGLDVRIPINPNLFDIDVAGLKYKTEMGEVNYKLDSSELVWSLSDITGRKTVKMMAELPITGAQLTLQQLEHTLNNRETFDSTAFSDTEDSESELDKFYGVNGTSSSSKKRILNSIRSRSFNYILVTFKIPMMSYSGLKLSYLKVEEDLMKYSCFPWVKYTTEATPSTDSTELAASAPPHSYRFKLASDCFRIG